MTKDQAQPDIHNKHVYSKVIIFLNIYESQRLMGKTRIRPSEETENFNLKIHKESQGF